MTLKNNFYKPPILDGSLYFRTLNPECREATLLLHGYLENGEIWLPWLRNQSWPTRLIIPDLPAHGLSASTSTPADMNCWAQALWQYLEAHHIPHPLNLIGHSMGGYLALEMAHLYPSRVKQLVLFHSTPLPDTISQQKNRQRQIHLLLKGKQHLLLKEVGTTLFAPQNLMNHANDIQKIHHMAAQCTTKGMINCLKAMAQRSNYSSTLTELGKKALLITGQHDAFMPADYGAQLARQFTNIEHLHLQEAGHASFLEQPEETLSKVTNFLFSGNHKINPH